LLLKVKTFNRLYDQTHQLKRMQESLENEIEQRKSLEKKKDEFISIASHELKTPLTSVRGYIQLIERLLAQQNTNPAIKTYISKARSQINKLGDLVADLLDVSKIDSGKMEFTIKPFKFDEMISEVVENIQQIHPDYSLIKK